MLWGITQQTNNNKITTDTRNSKEKSHEQYDTILLCEVREAANESCNKTQDSGYFGRG